MLGLRPYKPCDAKTVLSWCRDELDFRRWTSDRYDHYPVTAEDMNRKYYDLNGDCAEEDNFYPMTAFDENGPVGHLIMRFTDAEKTTLRLGFVIVDSTRRGKGYGREMIGLALRFAFEMMRADKVTIGVFDTNPGAYRCYKAAGFRDVKVEHPDSFAWNGEVWNVLELEMDREVYFSGK